MDSRSDSDAHANPNPFGTAEGDAEGESWAKKVTSTEPLELVPTTTTSTELSKAKTQQTADGHLTIVDTVKSAAHVVSKKLHLHDFRATGPSKFFHPTKVHVHVHWRDHGQHSNSEDGEPPHGHYFIWRSRDNRKGRNSIAIPTSYATSPSTPMRAKFQFRFGEVSRNLWRMMSTFPYWDMSFWSGWAYTWGSVLFVIDGGFSFTNVAFPDSELPTLPKYGGPLCFFIGALLYQLGAVMAYLEAVNDGSFQGSAMRRFLEGHEDDQKKMVDERIHSFFGHFVPHFHFHHKHNEKADEESSKVVDADAGWNTKYKPARRASIYPPGKAPVPRRGAVDLGEAEEGTSREYLLWRWWPTWHALRTHHVYEIGYLACAIQLFGATLYGITGVVVLPGILTSLQHWQKEGAFWIPQIVASVCFLTASLFFALETQEKWYRPEPTIIGWWIGVWATIGSVGFLLSAIFGTAQYHLSYGEYQADLSSMWGSAAYLISSFLQWYEAMNKNPIEEMFNEPGQMKSFQVHPI